MKDYQNLVIKFITENGWVKDRELDNYQTYIKKNIIIGIDVDCEDIFLWNEDKYNYFNLDENGFYSLLEYLIQNRLILNRGK